jgi:hypothetical protein
MDLWCMLGLRALGAFWLLSQKGVDLWCMLGLWPVLLRFASATTQ